MQLQLEAHWSRIVPKPDDIYGVPLARSSHGTCVIRLNNVTRIYIFGGENDPRVPIQTFQSTWCAEPEPEPEPKDASNNSDRQSWRWRCIVMGDEHAGELVPPLRVAHSQCSADGSKIYVFGGRCGITMGESSFNDLWVLDCSVPGKEYWQQVQCLGDLPEPRSYHQMVATSQALFLFGGCAANGRLNDLHRFNFSDSTWKPLSPSALAGRGGASLLVLDNGNKIAVFTGFVGHETNDGQIFNTISGTWETDEAITIHEIQPRSVCSFASGLYAQRLGEFAVIFGGEVESSKLGHSGAGAFDNRLLILHGSSGHLTQTISPQHDATWPMQRGWASAASIQGEANFYIFGGLAGDDENPIRLDDLWLCTFK